MLTFNTYLQSSSTSVYISFSTSFTTLFNWKHDGIIATNSSNVSFPVALVRVKKSLYPNTGNPRCALTSAVAAGGTMRQEVGSRIRKSWAWMLALNSKVTLKSHWPSQISFSLRAQRKYWNLPCGVALGVKLNEHGTDLTQFLALSRWSIQGKCCFCY